MTVLDEAVDFVLTGDPVEDLLSALLRVDPRLGQADGDWRQAQANPAVRRAVVQQLIKPTIHRHIVVVDYDDPALQQLDPQEHVSIHDALDVGMFAVPRSGQHTTEVFEIFTDHVLSTAQQLRLIELLGHDLPCRAEARDTYNTVLRDVTYPRMAHCGDPFLLSETVAAVPSLMQVESGRMLNACRLSDRWSQTFSLLSVPRRS